MSDKNFKVKNGITVGDNLQLTPNTLTSELEVSMDGGATKAIVATKSDLSTIAPAIHPMFSIGGN